MDHVNFMFYDYIISYSQYDLYYMSFFFIADLKAFYSRITVLKKIFIKPNCLRLTPFLI